MMVGRVVQWDKMMPVNFLNMTYNKHRGQHYIMGFTVLDVRICCYYFQFSPKQKHEREKGKKEKKRS
ncbi:hypothetical protein RIF29_23204 [Crotalaria pallida]|uniref:Uncharacterized protein n=1 Tax=Crotalaria pallida TaxID=3830 RepID=A0AAN9FE93_CROPI